MVDPKEEETYYQTSIYISNVDIHPKYQGRSLCRKILEFAINYIKNKLKKDKMFIENASSTDGGKPACYCYFKAAINTGFNVLYEDPKKNRLEKMKMSHCNINKPKP